MLPSDHIPAIELSNAAVIDQSFSGLRKVCGPIKLDLTTCIREVGGHSTVLAFNQPVIWSSVAQWKRARLITQRSEDRNRARLTDFAFIFSH
jgi:hypothetical protein